MNEQLYCRIYHRKHRGWFWSVFRQDQLTGRIYFVRDRQGPFRDRTEAENNFHNWIRMQSDLEVEFVS